MYAHKYSEGMAAHEYKCKAIHQQYRGYLCVSLVLVMPLPSWVKTGSHLGSNTHMYSEGMAVLANKVHANVILYTSGTQVYLRYLCMCSLVLVVPLPSRRYLAILVCNGCMHTCVVKACLHWQTTCIQM